MQDASSQHQAIYAELTREEHAAVIEKMTTMVALPAGHLPRQDELYLEQQLTDMFGFEVTAELEGVRLPHSIGVMRGMPHLRRFPTDTLAQHGLIHQAGIKTTRSGFGWMTEFGQLTEQGVLQEKYAVAAQVQFLPTWKTSPLVAKNWLKFRKMVVINPIEQRAMIVSLADVAPAEWMQYQFAGSPETMREGRIWTSAARGRVLFFFVNDPDQRVQFGPLELRYDIG